MRINADNRCALDNSEDKARIGEEMEIIILSLFIRMARNKIDDIKRKKI